MSGGGDNVTTTQAPWSGQSPYLQDLFQQAQQWFQQPEGATGRSLQLGQEGAQAYEGAAAPAGNIASSAAKGQQFLASGDVLNPESNPALQQYIDLANQATTRSFQQGVLPSLKGGAVQAGNVGSSRAGIAEGLASQGVTRQIAQQTAGLASAGYGQGLNAMSRGLALAPQTAALQTVRGDVLTGAGEAYRGLETRTSDQRLQQLANYQRLLSGNFGQVNTAPSQTGGLSGAIGGAAVGYQIGGGYGAAAGAVAGYFS